MFNHLLVPLDGSEYSERALPYARDQAKTTGAKVTLLTVVLRHPLAHLPRVAELDEHSRQLADQYLEGKVKSLQDEGVASVEGAVVFGEPAPSIGDLAKSSSADLIVMSTHGVGASGGHAVGCVAMRVLMTAPCPVLMVRCTDVAPA